MKVKILNALFLAITVCITLSGCGSTKVSSAEIKASKDSVSAEVPTPTPDPKVARQNEIDSLKKHWELLTGKSESASPWSAAIPKDTGYCGIEVMYDEMGSFYDYYRELLSNPTEHFNLTEAEVGITLAQVKEEKKKRLVAFSNELIGIAKGKSKMPRCNDEDVFVSRLDAGFKLFNTLDKSGLTPEEVNIQPTQLLAIIKTCLEAEIKYLNSKEGNVKDDEEVDQLALRATLVIETAKQFNFDLEKMGLKAELREEESSK